MKINRSRGFTLIEVLVVVVIMTIIVTLGAPAFLDTLDKRRVINATKALVSQLQQARSLSILLNRPVTLEFKYTSGNNWCFGVTDRLDCDCSSTSTDPNDAGVCSVDKPEGGGRVFVKASSNAYPGVVLSDVSAATRIVFEPTRGVRIDASGPSVGYTFSSTRTARQTTVNLNVIGKASACSAGETLLGGLKPC